MDSDFYKTIAQPSEGFYKDRGSKFYAFAFPVCNEVEIKSFREQIRKKYYDARHHVFAYRLGIDKNISRASDDGEPANSSGPPVLNAIKSFDLTNILIIVVRYFGGKKLGIPGLINAYKSAATDAINNAKIIKKIAGKKIKITFPFSELNVFMQIFKKYDVQFIEQIYEADCRFTIYIKNSLVDSFLNKINNSNLKFNLS
jgi:uncharacterized YigZ family protein